MGNETSTKTVVEGREKRSETVVDGRKEKRIKPYSTKEACVGQAGQRSNEAKTLYG